MMKNSLLQYELMGRIKPYCMFMQATERALIKKGVEDGNRKVVYFVPNSFSQSIRFFTEHMRTGAPVTHPDLELDAFLVTVSPMDRHGYSPLGQTTITPVPQRGGEAANCRSKSAHATCIWSLAAAHIRSGSHR
jgi:acyl-CoA hydrolase